MPAKKSIKKFFYKNGVSITTSFILLLIAINVLFTFKSKEALKESQLSQLKYDRIKFFKDNILINLNNTDMSVRGFLLVENEAFLETLSRIKRNQVDEFDSLYRLIPQMGLDPSMLSEIKTTAGNYNLLMEEVVNLKKAGNSEKALQIVKEDHGTGVWLKFVEFSKKFDPLIIAKKDETEAAYKYYASISLIFQIIPFIIGIPALIFGARLLQKNAKKRIELYKSLDENNRNLIFNSNQEIDSEDERLIVGSMIENLNKTASFIKQIGKGKYDIQWEGLDESNAGLNKNNIAGELMNMRDEMKRKQIETDRQKWCSEGLNKLSEILRDNQGDFYLLTEKTTSFIVNYIDAQQGALFVLNEEDETRSFLELVSCYAFNRTKHITKEIEIGEGLVGQIFLEAQPIHFTKVPADYLKITSGLGESTPNCLVIQPLIHNEKVEAVLEIASFNDFDSFTMDFLEQSCKTIAASIVSMRVSQKTKILLEKSQQQAEEMKAQEEEMRQNMEELEATQEEMKRKENELRKLLEQVQAGDVDQNNAD
ncbi:MAG TPA: GAF domain-containing protein [Cytophagales bacterium]|nr:GAF domain-containing protein [Cytophagales bacterium]